VHVTKTPIRLAVATAVLVAGAATASACSHAGAAATAGQAPSGHAAAATGDGPSVSATMICAPDATGGIAVALGIPTSSEPAGSWSDHVYSCRYVYPNGVMVLSVKELPDAAATNAYYTAAQNSLPSFTALEVLGLSGFSGPDGSVYVRKDFKVLHVDVAALPDHIGQPPRTRADAAFTVAAVIMSCWNGG
jgi:hypothetical protein